MGKMMSLLEKYKLIEKEDAQMSSDNTNEVSVNEDFSDPLADTTDLALQEVFLRSDSIEEVESTEVEHSDPIDSNEPDIASPPPKVVYNRLMSIQEIYEHLSIGDIAITNSVFLLENLIKALPAELPEFVKKTTINNIITASAMDLPHLLEDGCIRLEHLKQFSKDFTTTNETEITNLQSEITRLSAIISDYQQQIKHMENLIADEKSLVQAEQNRIETILEFFEHS